MIQFNNVTKKYGKKEAVKNITLTLPRGRIIGLVGENGSGKSTLLKIMSGVSLPQYGKITLDGVNVSKKTANHVAYLPDADEIYPYFTVKQLFQYYDSQFPDFNFDKACIVAQFLDIDLNASLKKLSKGNRGRAKIAATLGREVDYYLLDEPLSGLDPMVRQSIIKGFIQFVDTESQTIILSTHELKDVEPILDNIVVLRDGNIIANEPVEAIRELQRIDITTWMTRLFREGEINGNKANS
ncbi:ABC transporter ATP-binding protein [Psychrobacillus sp. FJAT-51614]|uniref:ABC transporter ATP-binding protein n=1 Tax=Psychrobacillus mangrovi TaxID=3117745 RepID=A0ABU8F8F6_9BACI